MFTCFLSHFKEFCFCCVNKAGSHQLESIFWMFFLLSNAYLHVALYSKHPICTVHPHLQFKPSSVLVCLGAFCEHVFICGFTAMKEKWKETALKCSTVSVVSGRWRKSELCGACLRVSLMIVYIPKLGMHRYIGQTSAQPDLRLVDHSLLCKQECIYWRECFLIFFSTMPNV